MPGRVRLPRHISSDFQSILMKKTYTKDEMTRLWRERAGLEPAVTGCSVTRHDGIDVDAIIERRAREWYLGLLNGGERRCLAEEDIAPRVNFVTDSNNIGRCALPLDVCRVFEVRMAGWLSSAKVVAEPPARLLAMLDNPYCRLSPSCPAAWTEGNTLCVAPASQMRAALTDAVTILAAVDPGDGCFILDECALATIPVFNPLDY